MIYDSDTVKDLHLAPHGHKAADCLGCAPYPDTQVSEATQAAYMKRAFGLRRSDGTRKPSWYAFAHLRER